MRKARVLSEEQHAALDRCTAADDETMLAVMAEPRKVRDAHAVNSDRN